MTTPRRRIIRPSASVTSPHEQQQLHKLRARLEQERAALTRWQRRLRRAFNTVEKQQRRIRSLERRIARLEE
jgi:hypothetical protein